MIVYGMGAYGINIPCHVKKELKIISGSLQVMHISYPQPACIMFVCLVHLVIYQSWLGGG